ncbi:unnamed protein product [Urochloa decumbens]|uniref:PMI1/PMIR1-2 C-terminal domain-containing protein n=1 Tax=Urochloa decumbens TaxID=240449 RepID=A0ABC9FBU9_9POAL
MSSKKPAAAPAPAVVSTGCSGLMSCLSRHRRGPPQPAPPRGSEAPARRSDAEAAEMYRKRVQLLEEEIRRLSLWLGQEEERPAPPLAAECVVRAGSAKAMPRGASAAATGERVRNGGKARDESGLAAMAMVPATTTRCVRVGQAAVGGEEIVARLEDGSYLREIRRAGRPWGRLAVQVSRPVVPEDAASASEVLDKMAAMRADDLCKFLVEMMPLKDITGQQNPGEPVRRRAAARLSSGDDLLEALIIRAMDKLESLVLEGLKIQMASPAVEPATVAAVVADRRRDDEAAVGKDDCMVHVVLMQVRDPNERYGAIGDTMLGLVEASLQRKDGTVKLEMQGMHVAGISFVNRKPSGDGRCAMWSASLRQCTKGPHGGDGCQCACVRNPDRVFKR